MGTTKIKMLLKWIVLFFSFSVSYSRIGFIKDQSVDKIEFPPRVYKKFSSGIPTGHLRPLGWQRPPEGKVDEITYMPEPKEFYETYVKHNKPVVFRDVMQDVPAVKKWAKDDYLKKTYGDLQVHVVVKKELFVTGPKKMKMKKFLKEYLYEDWYLSDIVPQEMTHELALPKCLKCGLRNYLMESEIWFSSGGTSSLMHSHADHDLHCLLAGRKDFTFVKRQYKDKFEYVDRIWPGAGYSKLDMDMINMFKNKDIGSIPWTWSTLNPGDCIFVPSGVMHHVRSFGRSFSSTYHFAPQPVEISFDDCKEMDLNKFFPLSEATFIWSYANGESQLTNAKLNANSLKHHLLLLMRNSTVLTFELFEDFYKEVMGETKAYEDASSVWSKMDPDNDKKITRNEIIDLSESVAEKVAKALNEPHSKQFGKKATDEL